MITKFLLDLIFPIRCLACNRISKNYLCPHCFPQLNFIGKVKGKKLANIDELLAVLSYRDDLAKLLIKTYKFKSIQGIAYVLAEYLRIFWQSRSLLQPAELIVIPIPCSTQRIRERGFSQVKLISQLFANQFNYQHLTQLKRHNRKSQTKLGAKKRQTNPKNSFYWIGPKLENATVLLIDDIVTTGATLTTASAVLRQAGATKIIALALFRA